MLPPLPLPRFVPDPGLGPILFLGYDKKIYLQRVRHDLATEQQ